MERDNAYFKCHQSKIKFARGSSQPRILCNLFVQRQRTITVYFYQSMPAFFTYFLRYISSNIQFITLPFLSMRPHQLILIIATITSVCCRLSFFRIFNLTGTVKINMKSLKITENLVTFLGVEENYIPYITCFSPFAMKYKNISFTTSEEYQAAPSNTPNGVTNDNLIYTTSQLTRYFNTFSSSTVYMVLINTNETIIQCVYGPTNDETAVIIKNLTGPYYQVVYLLNGTKLGNVALPVSATETLTKYQVSQGKLYLLFQTKLLIISFNSSLTMLKTMSFPNVAGSIPRFHVNQTLLGYSTTTTAYLASMNNSYAILDSVNIGEQIIDLRIGYPYLFISSLANFYQYDMDIKLLINTFPHAYNFTGFRFQIHKNIYLMFFETTPISPYMYSYKFDGTIVCPGNCTSCPMTYYLNSTTLLCMKNYSAIVVPNITTTNSSTNSTEPIISSQSSSSIPQIFIVLGKSLTFQTTNFLPKFISMLSIILDDIWYYKYHRIQYTDSIKMFMSKVDWINYFRLSNWFFKLQDKLDLVTIGQQENLLYTQVISFHQHNPQSVYFLNSSKEIYLDGLILNLIIYLFSKILHFLLFCLKGLHLRLLELYHWIRINTKWWTFFLMLIQSNMMRFAFNATLQFDCLVSFNFITKINVVLSILTLAGLLLYAGVFNLAIFKLETKGAAKSVLVYSQYNKNSFMFEGFCFTFRNFLRGFLQAALMKSYTILIIALTLSDLFFLTLCLIFKSRFINRLIFLGVTLYSCSFFFLDLVLVIHVYRAEWLESRVDYEQFTFITVFTLLGAFLLCFFFLFLESVKFAIFTIRRQCNTSPKKSQNELKNNYNNSIEISNSKQAQAIIMKRKSGEDVNEDLQISANKRMKSNTKVPNSSSKKPKKEIHMKANNLTNVLYIYAQKIHRPTQNKKLKQASPTPTIETLVTCEKRGKN